MKSAIFRVWIVRARTRQLRMAVMFFTINENFWMALLQLIGATSESLEIEWEV